MGATPAVTHLGAFTADAVKDLQYGLDYLVDGITAKAGGTQAAATPLTGAINKISTVASAQDSVRLPASIPGMAVVVINDGAQPLQVFGAGTDTIADVATATGVSQAKGVTATYFCNVVGNWETDATGPFTPEPIALAASGAINPHCSGVYALTKAGVAAMTLAAPTTGVDDGITIEVFSTTANQHTLTFTGSTLQSGAAGALTATWPVSAGGGIKVYAYAAKWVLIANNLVVIS